MEPLVSVLLPVRDAALTLPACLTSLAAQTLVDHEVVAVDDGSRDGSGALLREAARGDPRIRVLSGPPRGLVASLTQARRLARAPLLARMDADDVAHPRRLELQCLRLADDPALALVATAVRLLSDPDVPNDGMRDYVTWSNALTTHQQIVRDIHVESPLVHPSVVLRAAALDAVGGYRDGDGPEDYELWLRGHRHGWRFAKLPQALLDWRDSATRLTRCDPRYATDRFREWKLADLASRAGGRGFVVWGAGPCGKAFGRALQARGDALLGYVEVAPRKLGQRIHGVPVVPLAQAVRWPDAVHLGAVAGSEARARMRAEAERLGLCDGRDYFAVA